MHLRIRRRIVATALAPLVAVAACATGRTTTSSAAGEVEPVRNEVTVRVDNAYSNFVDVYAVGNGIVSRLGTVNVGGPTVFRLRLGSFPPGQQIQLVAVPLAGRGRATSGPLSIEAGEVIDFRVDPLLNGSVLIR